MEARGGWGGAWLSVMSTTLKSTHSVSVCGGRGADLAGVDSTESTRSASATAHRHKNESQWNSLGCFDEESSICKRRSSRMMCTVPCTASSSTLL